MEQIKRLRTNITHDYADSKRKKIRITTAETRCLREEFITTLEDLPNELICEIFEFLDFHHAFLCFYNLNQRFQNLFGHSNLPIKTNISSISKCSFHRYLTHIIIPHTYRIQSLRLSNPFAANMCFLLFPIMRNFTRLETVIINNIQSDYVEKVVNHLSSLSVLSSLTIISIGYIKNQNDIYRKIFRLPALKYCQMLIEQYLRPLPIATNEFSPIEHLVINNKVSLIQLDSLLSYVPQLRRLSFAHLDGCIKINRTHRSSITLNHLTDVSLKLFYVDFNDFEVLVTDRFRQVQVLRIEILSFDFSVTNTRYLNADRWERIISTYMINLRIIDLQLECCLWYRGDHQTYETEVSKFNSSFWAEHQWFFEHQYYKTAHSDKAILNSINPCRRKYYMVYEESNENCWSRLFKTEDLVHHVYIHSRNAMKQFVSNFPNATELTLSKYFDGLDDSTVASLNDVIPLRHLTKLTLGYHQLPIEQVIQLLHFTPNVHTLKLESIVLYPTDSVPIEQNGIFEIVSNTNNVRNLTIDEDITLDKIQLLVALFPRLEYLTINLCKQNLKSIARFLLSKSNDNTRHLSSLCITKQRKDFKKILSNLLKSKKLLDNCTLRVIHQKLYLWW